jgi:rRNA maturation RNase YbeY
MEKRGVGLSSTKEAMHGRLEVLATRVLFLLGRSEAYAEIFLLPNKEMVAMKRQFFKDFSPAPKKGGEYPYPQADVLAFEEKGEFPVMHDGKNRIGEIYLNWELYKNDTDRLAFLVIHGILHLLGYRHEKRRDIIQMEMLERTLWRQICLSV